MENAKRTYEVLNSELHDELPALYDSRVLFLVTNMQTLFAAEEVFHSETSKVLLLLLLLSKTERKLLSVDYLVNVFVFCDNGFHFINFFIFINDSIIGIQ